MKQEYKELLLKDLCSRLPYGVKVEITHWRNRDKNMIDHKILRVILDINKTNILINTTIDVKPYLLPLSSMTEEQQKEFDQLIELELKAINDEIAHTQVTAFEVDFYNKNHFDYRGLIEKGLAIDCTNLNIY